MSARTTDFGTDRDTKRECCPLQCASAHSTLAVVLAAGRAVARAPVIRMVLYDVLDRIIVAHPEALADLLRRASDEELAPIVALAR